MPICQITLSANAGAALQLGGIRLWVDALHDKAVSGFSTLSPELQAAVAVHPDFAEPNLIFYTHCHPDHFSQRLTRLAMERWPFAKAILPERQFENQLLLSRPREQLFLPELSVQFIRLPHEGEQYANVAHYGCLLDGSGFRGFDPRGTAPWPAPLCGSSCRRPARWTWLCWTSQWITIRLPHEGEQYANVAHYGCLLDGSGFRVLIPGDCAVASPALREFLQETGPVDLALLDFPWITLSKGKRFIEQFIRPRCLAVYHLPFASDDIFGYRRAVFKAAEQVQVEDLRLFLEPLQREIFE